MILKYFTPFSYTNSNTNMAVQTCEVAEILLSVLASALAKGPQILYINRSSKDMQRLLRHLFYGI